LRPLTFSEKLQQAVSSLEEKVALEAPEVKKVDVEEDPIAETTKHSHRTWVQLADHFCFKVGQMEKTCKIPLPETQLAEQKLVAEAKVKEEEDRMERRRNDKLPFQSFMKECYESTAPQMIVAGAICLNFLVSATKAEMLPEEGDDAMVVFFVFEVFFNLLFGIELLVNMYANFFCPFWKDSWNIFDFFIVLISWLSMMKMLNGSISVLRLFRAFRVFRLFKRVKSLRQIIAGIGKSLPGVSNAFLILTIVMCIYAILAVEFYKDVGRGCREPDYGRTGFSTNRKAQSGCMGNEYFGTFSKSIYSFFQVLTGESWSENVSRPVIWYFTDNIKSFGSALFFVSFVLITAFVLTNVVVAVLLDKMTANEEEAEGEAATAAEAETVAVPTELTPHDLKVAKQLGKLQGTLGELGSSAVDLQKDFDKAKSDMAEVREQIGLLVKAIERKYRLACL